MAKTWRPFDADKDENRPPRKNMSSRGGWDSTTSIRNSLISFVDCRWIAPGVDTFLNCSKKLFMERICIKGKIPGKLEHVRTDAKNNRSWRKRVRMYFLLIMIGFGETWSCWLRNGGDLAADRRLGERKGCNLFLYVTSNWAKMGLLEPGELWFETFRISIRVPE